MDLPLCPLMQASWTIGYIKCTISDDSWAGKHERRNDHMIYLTLSRSLEVLFPFRLSLIHTDTITSRPDCRQNADNVYSITFGVILSCIMSVNICQN